MKEKSTSEGLLDTLCQLVGYENLSDLRFPVMSDRIKMASQIESLKAENYSLKEWSDAVRYISGMTVPFACVEEAADFLTECLRKKI